MFTQVIDKSDDPRIEALILELSNHARSLYETRQMLCTEAVLVALNKGLNGGLTDKQALAMAAPFCIGIGESGCICGALSGAVLASGLLLGKGHSLIRRKFIRKSGRELHDTFKHAHGATCCRVLSKSVRHDKKIHFNHCAELTASAAEMAARLVLNQRPELIDNLDPSVKLKPQSRLAWLFSLLFRGPTRG